MKEDYSHLLKASLNLITQHMNLSTANICPRLIKDILFEVDQEKPKELILKVFNTTEGLVVQWYDISPLGGRLRVRSRL